MGFLGGALGGSALGRSCDGLLYCSISRVFICITVNLSDVSGRVVLSPFGLILHFLGANYNTLLKLMAQHMVCFMDCFMYI